MANSKNTKKDRDEKKSSDLSELNESYSTPSYGTASKSDSETAGSEFTSKYSSRDDDEKDQQTSAYASKINKSFGESEKSRDQSNGGEKESKDDDDYSYTSQLGNDQRSGGRIGEQYANIGNQGSGRTHQLSYDQQFRYQQPSQQSYTPSYQQPYSTQQSYGSQQSYGTQQYDTPNYQQNYQGYSNQEYNSNQGYNQRFTNRNQPYESQQRYSNRYSQEQGQFRNSGYAQQSNQGPGPGYAQTFYGPTYDQPQGFNQAYNYGKQFGNQQFVNRGYENHNYNDQSNRLRSSFNTQGFGDSIYRHENYHPEAGGSGYSGSTFGGEGSGEFRSNQYQQPYGNPSFPTHRQEFRNPSRGYTRNYRFDEEHRNDYQRDEDNILGYRDEEGFENDYTPYGNEREERFQAERERGFSRPGRSRYPSNRNAEGRNNEPDFERGSGSFDRQNRRNRNRRNY
jgi:hypothetical protein